MQLLLLFVAIHVIVVSPNRCCYRRYPTLHCIAVVTVIANHLIDSYLYLPPPLQMRPAVSRERIHSD